jgi:flagellar protein FlaG
MTGTRAEVTSGAAAFESAASRAPRAQTATEARDARPQGGPRAGVAPAPEKPIEPAEFPLRNLSIRMDPDTHRVVVEVLDAQTGEVIRRIPPEELSQLDRDLGTRSGRIVEREA